MRVARYISPEVNQEGTRVEVPGRTQPEQDKQQQYTIYKEGGPGFTRYIVYMDNRETQRAMRRHKSLPPRERRRTGVSRVQGKMLHDSSS